MIVVRESSLLTLLQEVISTLLWGYVSAKPDLKRHFQRICPYFCGKGINRVWLKTDLFPYCKSLGRYAESASRALALQTNNLQIAWKSLVEVRTGLSLERIIANLSQPSFLICMSIIWCCLIIYYLFIVYHCLFSIRSSRYCDAYWHWQCWHHSVSIRR